MSDLCIKMGVKNPDFCIKLGVKLVVFCNKNKVNEKNYSFFSHSSISQV